MPDNDSPIVTPPKNRVKHFVDNLFDNHTIAFAKLKKGTLLTMQKRGLIDIKILNQTLKTPGTPEIPHTDQGIDGSVTRQKRHRPHNSLADVSPEWIYTGQVAFAA